MYKNNHWEKMSLEICNGNERFYFFGIFNTKESAERVGTWHGTKYLIQESKTVFKVTLYVLYIKDVNYVPARFMLVKRNADRAK